MMQRRGFLVALAALAGAVAWPDPGSAESLKEITLRVDGMT
jgi:hypothetical protein